MHKPHKPWTSSWDFIVGAILAVAAVVVSVTGPRYATPISVIDAFLTFGGLVLGTGLLLDVWRLVVQKVEDGPKEQAMCVESVVGAGAIFIGLMLFLVDVPQWYVNLAPKLGFVAFCFMFSAWVHDMVWVKRDGRLRFVREPDHGSFIVFGVRRQRRKSQETATRS